MSTKNEPGKLDPYPGNLKRHDVERRDAHVTDPEWSLNVEAVNHAHEKTLRESCEAALASRDATIAELRSEVEEQARLLGAGASREAALMAEVKRLREVAQVACDALPQASKMLSLAEIIYRSVECGKAKDTCNSALSKLSENGITPTP
jgi:hypothetical protein